MRNSGDGFFQKDFGTIFLMLVVFGFIGFAAFAVNDGKHTRIFNYMMYSHYVGKAQEHLAYFDINPDKRAGGLEQELTEIELAAEAIMRAGEYGDPPVEISSDIFEKLKGYRDAHTVKSTSSLQESMKRYDKFWAKFSELVDKRNR